MTSDAANPPNADPALIQFLEQNGHTVTKFTSTGSTPQGLRDAAAANQLVFISETIGSTSVLDPAGDANGVFSLRDSDVPVISFEAFMFDNAQWTGQTSLQDFGNSGRTGVPDAILPALDSMQIVSPAHPIAGGLIGAVQVYVNPYSFTFGKPGPEATVVASILPDGSYPCIFVYEKGTHLVDGSVAVNKRIVIFLGQGADPNANTVLNFANLTDQGKALILSTVAYAMESDKYASEVLADAPLVYYRFNEANGTTTAKDATSNAQDGAYANVSLGSASATAVLGSAAGFNNVSSSVAVPALGNQLSQVTLEVWLKPNSMVTFDTIFDDDGWDSGWVHFHLGDGSQIEFSLNGSTPTDNWMAGPAYFQNGQWTYVAMVYDSTALTLTLYVNGQPIDTRTYSSAIPANLAEAHIGAWNGNDRAFDGMMDEFALYGSALSADRILAHYLAAVGIAITTQPVDATVFTNATVTFTVEAVNSGGAPTYQWQRNGFVIAGATSATYTTPNLALANNGDKYHCVVSAGGNSATSRDATVTVLGHELVSGPLAWLSFDDTLADQGGSATPHDATFNGNASFDSNVANATAGTASVNLVGDGRVELANSADLNMDGGVPFSMAAWIKTDFTSGLHVILAKSPPGVTGCGDGKHTPALFVNEDGKLVYDVYCVGANISSTVVRNGAWTHVAVTYNGSNYRFYINGLQDATTGAYNPNGGANEGGDPSWVFTIGQSLNTIFPVGAWVGNIDEVAFWNSTLSPSQIFGVFSEGLPKVTIAITQQPADAVVEVGGTVTLAVAGTAVGTTAPLAYQWQRNGVNISDATNPSYTTPALVLTNNGDKFQCVLSAASVSVKSREAVVTVLEPEAAPGPIAWLSFDNTLADQGSSATAHDGAFVGNAAFDPTVPNATAGAASVNLVGDGRVELANSVDLNMDTGIPFTMAAWIKRDFASGIHVILAKSPAGVSSCDQGKHTPALFVNGGSLVYDVYCVGANVSSTAIPNGAWTHVAVTYDGSNYRFYINGQQDATTGAYNRNGGANQAGDPSWVFTIGDGLNLTYPVGPWVGNIDEVAFWNSTLSPAQIFGVFNRGIPKVTINITEQPADAVAPVGGTVTLAVAGTAVGTTAPLTYQWQRNGVNLPDATNTSYTTPALALTNNGDKFQCVLSAAGVSVKSRAATLTVVQLEVVSRPMAWLNFDNTLADQGGSATAHDGSFVGNAAFDPTVPNATAGAASVNLPVVGHVELANSVDLNMDTGVPFSMAAWLKPNFTDNNTHVIVAKSPAGVTSCGDGKHTPALFVNGGGNLVYDVYCVGANTSSTAIRNGAWTHVAVTYDGTNYRFYINGQQDATTGAYNANGGANQAGDPSWVFTIGDGLNLTYPVGAWVGNIDEVAFWQSALSPGQVYTVFARGVEAAAAPQLNYVKEGSQLTFSWSGPGYKLQENSDLAKPAGWSDVPGGGVSPVSVTIGAGNRFFRLIKP